MQMKILSLGGIRLHLKVHYLISGEQTQEYHSDASGQFYPKESHQKITIFLKINWMHGKTVTSCVICRQMQKKHFTTHTFWVAATMTFPTLKMQN